ncbi:MAG: transglycosylase domain-containing protein [Bacteroidales bacterium]|nr:transglycosylase domain-containing protein [Bacteroidales bacterium]
MTNRSKVRRFLKWFWIIYFSILGLILILFISISLGWLGFMPSFEELENPKSNLASEIISADQQLLGKYYFENRSNIHYSDLSPNLIQALLATEDIRFEDHSGVDGKALIRVILGVATFSHKGGGSTITQQLAKNLFPRKANRNIFETLIIKFKEWVTATKLERNYSKDEIIAMYFNTVPFGSQAFGVKSAAKTFFNKTPLDINKEEAALLVGILKAPTRYSPVRNPERAMQRRSVVLGQMRRYDYISMEEYDSLKVIPVDMSNFRMQDHNTGLATYFREYLRTYLKNWCNTHFKADGNPYNLYKDGLRIHTTINSKMQQYAENAMQEHMGKDLQPAFYTHWKGRRNAPFDRHLKTRQIDSLIVQAMRRSDRYRNLRKAGMPSDSIKMIFDTPVEMTLFSWDGDIDTLLSPRDSIRYYKYFLLAGMMSIEPQTAYVRAYVGGIDYRYFKYDHVKVGKRQVGSIFKPFLYTLAMQEGEFSPCSKVPNVPVSFELYDGTLWTPRNSSDDKEGEMVTLKWALANSVNYISAFLMKQYSPTALIQIARKMGVTSNFDTVPSICLGTPDISLYEMVGDLNTFVNKGVYKEPIFITRIEDKNGNIIEKFIPYQQEAMNEETAYLMLDLLKGVVSEGTGIRLRYKYKFNQEIAGKTGTTQNHSDGWFIGITPDLVTGVWVGAEDRSVHFRGITQGQGANMALPIWALYMKEIYSDTTLNISQEGFEKPSSGLISETDCDNIEQHSDPDNPFDDEKF